MPLCNAILALLLPVATAGNVEVIQTPSGEITITSGFTASPEGSGEAIARDLYGRALALVDSCKGDSSFVDEFLGVIISDYSDTRVFRRAESLLSESRLIGEEAPPIIPIRWLQGELTQPQERPTVVVFWENWCSYCLSELPMLQAKSFSYADRVDFVGLTKMSRDVTDEQVMSTLVDSLVTFPNGQVDQNFADQFGVVGIPTAAIVSEGRIVWRGHPRRLNDEVIGACLAE